MDDEILLKLIDLYRSNPVLWDYKYEGNSDKQLKTSVWKKIARQMGMGVIAVREQMNSMRNKYFAAIRNRKIYELMTENNANHLNAVEINNNNNNNNNKDINDNGESKYSWFKEMNFLDPLIEMRCGIFNEARQTHQLQQEQQQQQQLQQQQLQVQPQNEVAQQQQQRQLNNEIEIPSVELNLNEQPTPELMSQTTFLNQPQLQLENSGILSINQLMSLNNYQIVFESELPDMQVHKELLRNQATKDMPFTVIQSAVPDKNTTQPNLSLQSSAQNELAVKELRCHKKKISKKSIPQEESPYSDISSVEEQSISPVAHNNMSANDVLAEKRIKQKASDLLLTTPPQKQIGILELLALEENAHNDFDVIKANEQPQETHIINIQQQQRQEPTKQTHTFAADMQQSAFHFNNQNLKCVKPLSVGITTSVMQPQKIILKKSAALNKKQRTFCSSPKQMLLEQKQLLPNQHEFQSHDIQYPVQTQQEQPQEVLQTQSGNNATEMLQVTFNEETQEMVFHAQNQQIPYGTIFHNATENQQQQKLQEQQEQQKQQEQQQQQQPVEYEAILYNSAGIVKIQQKPQQQQLQQPQQLQATQSPLLLKNAQQQTFLQQIQLVNNEQQQKQHIGQAPLVKKRKRNVTVDDTDDNDENDAVNNNILLANNNNKIIQQNEFQTFATCISKQMEKFPEEIAYQLMGDIQNVIVEYKLEHLKVKKLFNRRSN